MSMPTGYEELGKIWTADHAYQMQVTTNIGKAEALLREIPGGAEKALDAAIKKARRSHSKLAEAAILQKYRITAEDLHKKDTGRGATRARIVPKFQLLTRADGYGVTHVITYYGNAIPLSDFNRNLMNDHRNPYKVRPIWRQRWHYKGGKDLAPPGVYHFAESLPTHGIGVFKGESHTFDHSFVAGMQAGHEGHIHWGLYYRSEEKKAQWDPQKKAIVGDATLAQTYGPSVAQMVANPDVRAEVDKDLEKRIDTALDEKIKLILDGKMKV